MALFLLVVLLSLSTLRVVISKRTYIKNHRLHKNKDDSKKNDNCAINNEYDYIIVGAGTAGSALAYQLSRDPKNTVLLIEEGGFSNQWKEGVVYASGWFGTQFNEQIDRQYFTTPQENLNNRTLRQPRGKLTGGSGSRNAMVWILGNQLDFDERWGPITESNWTWDDDLKYYWDYIESTFDIEICPESDPWIQRFIAAAQENDYQLNPDPNDLSNNGQGGVSIRRFMGEILSETDALRESTWTAYIEPVLSERDNLDIIVYTRVNKVLFDGTSAIGVETFGIGDYKLQQFNARKEVILSAGPFDTPKLLMLSGIGDCQELSDLDIECIANVPGVGKSLQDHTYTALFSPPLKNQSLDQLPTNKWPFDIFGTLAIEEEGNNYFGIDVTQNWYDGTDRIAININSEVFHLKSRGEVTLLDSNPETPPVINPKYLSNIEDQQRIVDAIKLGRDIMYSDAFQDLYDQNEGEIAPGDDVQTDEEILEWVKNNTKDDYHPAGTCSMGVVLDDRLRVNSVDNLRVIDSSIMPQLISGNPNQITIIIGLKGGDMILEDNGGDGTKIYQLYP